jgi:hypothetical protein
MLTHDEGTSLPARGCAQVSKMWAPIGEIGIQKKLLEHICGLSLHTCIHERQERLMTKPWSLVMLAGVLERQ